MVKLPRKVLGSSFLPINIGGKQETKRAKVDKENENLS